MRRFLYYIPGMPGVSPRVLANLGLLDRFTATGGAGGSLIEHCVTAVNDGPRGAGCIVAVGTQPPAVSPDSQWAAAESFHVCVEDLLPRPQDLERELGIAGPDITLADGQAWRVPLIRRWDPPRLEHASNLPKTLRPTFADGKTTFSARVKPEFASIDALADRIFKAFSEETTMPLDQACADAVELLAVNYRLGIQEAGLLGILDEETTVRVLSLSIDYESIQAQANEWSVEGLHAAEPVIEEE